MKFGVWIEVTDACYSMTWFRVRNSSIFKVSIFCHLQHELASHWF